MDKLRRAVFDSLLRCAREERYANLELNAALSRGGFNEGERALFTRLFYGVIERQIALDSLIDAFSSRRGIEQKVRILLRMGLYQILYMDSIPDHAAVSETVELTKSVCHAGTHGFVNGILRSAVRRRDSLPLPPEGSCERLAFESGCPLWLCRLWREQYGEKADAIALATNRQPPMTLRVNTLKLTRDELIAHLNQAGIPALPTDSPYGVRLMGSCPISALPLEEGLCFVQDEASQICAEMLGAQAGERVLDVCACPGGKSFSIAMLMENRGELIACDLHESKLSLIETGAGRLGISIIRTEARDGRLPPPRGEEPFDRILCDVPCSGLGVIAKKPDLRHKNPEDLTRLPAIQSAILNAAAARLRAGGVLVYSTCTLNRDENEAVVDAFLASHPDFFRPEGGQRTFLPTEGTDGFFVARMERKP